MRNLEAHIAGWEKTLNEYGGSMKDDAASLRIMFLGILPEAEEERLSLKEERSIQRGSPSNST